MHMAFLSRVFKNLQWYGMTLKILKPEWFQDFSFLYGSMKRAVLLTLF